MTKILQCTCKHEQQDQMYGKGNRVMNKTFKGEFRCTVCAQVKRGE